MVSLFDREFRFNVHVSRDSELCIVNLRFASFSYQVILGNGTAFPLPSPSLSNRDGRKILWDVVSI